MKIPGSTSNIEHERGIEKKNIGENSIIRYENIMKILGCCKLVEKRSEQADESRWEMRNKNFSYATE